MLILFLAAPEAFSDGLIYFYDGPYKGKVIELETKKPIEGAVIAATWLITTWVHTEKFCDAKETISDKNGEFELPKGWCISHPFAKIDKPWVVVFKPGYLGYPPLGYNEEERISYMPKWGNPRLFENKNQYNIIELGRSKTLAEKKLTLNDAEMPFMHAEALHKLPNLLRLTDEESMNLGLGERR